MKKLMRGSIILVLFIFLTAGQILPQTSKAPDPWARLNFLIGEWVGVGTGTPGEAVGGTTFATELDKKILVRKNWAKYPPKQGEKAGLSHEDLLIIYPSPGKSSYRAIYFDSEDHVINYLISFPETPDSAVFETDPAQEGPRFRMTYALAPDRTLKNVFWIATSGEGFRVYVQGTLKKKS